MKELIRAVFEGALVNIKILIDSSTYISQFTFIFLLIQTKDNNCGCPYKTWLEIDKAMDVSRKFSGSPLKKIGLLTF